MSEAKYLYLASLTIVLLIIFIPAVLKDTYGGVEDVEPYGVFKTTLQITNFTATTVVSSFDILLSSTLEDELEIKKNSFINGLENYYKILSLIPIWAYAILLVPLLIVGVYALIKALPTT